MSADLELLMARYFDGTARDEEIRKLDELLRGDAETRRQMLLAAGRETSLREVFGADVHAHQVEPESVELARPEIRRGHEGRRRRERPSSKIRLTAARSRSRKEQSPREVVFPVLAAAALLLGVTLFILWASGGSSPQNAQQPVVVAPKPSADDSVRERGRREREVERLKLERKAVQERLAEIAREAERVKAEQAPAEQNEREQLLAAEALQHLEARRKEEEAKLAEARAAEKRAEQDLARPIPPRQTAADSAELGRVVFVADGGDAAARPARVRGQGQEALREPLTQGMAFQAGDRIETGAPATGQTVRPVRAAVEMKSGATVDLVDGTSFEVLGAAAVALAEGRVYAELPALSSGVAPAVGGLTVKTVFADVELESGSADLACDRREAVLQVEDGAASLSNVQGRRALKALQKSVVRKDFAPGPTAPILMSSLWRGRKGPAAGTVAAKANPPQPPLAGLKIWFKADVGIPADARRCVSSWQDASGNVLAQTKAAAQPLWVENALNGKPALRFDGKDDFLTSSIVPASGAEVRTIFAVVGNMTPGLSKGFVVHYGNQRNNEAYGIYCDTTGFGNYYWGINHSVAVKGNSGPMVLCACYDGKEDRLWANGKDLGAKVVALKTGSGQGLRIGSKILDGQYLFQGDVAEVLAYGRALSDAERKQVEEYLSEKFGR